MSGVSVVIPNYNGYHLLEKHLPSVTAALRSGDEIVIIDDCSTDTSWEWLSKYFSAKVSKTSHTAVFDGERAEGTWKHGTTKGPVQLLRNAVNQRFAMSCNKAVEHASHPLIFLLNSDVSPHKDTVKKLVQHLESDDVFAVGCKEFEYSAENGVPVIGGKNELVFKRGMFIHSRARSYTSGETAWASGGSSMFSREKWLVLGGFDLDYYPAYWEDVDLSTRAKKHSWKVLFDEEAQVDHHHESTNTSAFGQKKMRRMSWQHAHTFVEKHASFWQKLQYYLWQPYWWVKMPIFAAQQLQFLFFLLVVLITFLVRSYQLAEVPHGMAWDEAAIGYNGYTIAHSGRDEWRHKLPISFQSFGDYKAPLAIYINAVSTLLFGMNLWAVRFPFMIAGVFGVIGMMILVKLLWSEWFPKQRTTFFPILDANSAALLAGSLMSVSAWHVHYSRVGFESGMALTFLIWGILGLVWLNHRHYIIEKQWLRTFIGFSSAVSIAASFYTYHSSKVVAPLLIITIAILFRRLLLKHKKAVVMWCIGLFLLLCPLLYDSFKGQGGDRFQQASIFGKDITPVQAAETIIDHFWVHLQPSYLVGGYTPTLRHGDGKWGVLYATEAALAVTAIIVFLYEISQQKRRQFLPPGLFYFAVAWTVIGILPAAIGVDVPHSNRMLLALPGFLLLAVLGWHAAAKLWNNRLLAPAFLGTVLLLHFLLVFSYLNSYFTVFAKESAEAFSDGYLEAVEYAIKYEPSVDKVLFTSKYQQPYIYTLFGRKTNVHQYHMGSLIKYEFSDKITVGDLGRKRTVIIATPEEIEPKGATHLVYGSDGKVRFVIVKTE
jgi:GT2 family glycosyltransferase